MAHYFNSLRFDLEKETKNLFLTRTALGVYGTLLGAVFAATVTLAIKYDETGKLSAVDWVTAIAGVGSIGASQLVVLGSRLDSTKVPTFTPRGIPGPNKEEVENR
jgi:hypothetical protein